MDKIDNKIDNIDNIDNIDYNNNEINNNCEINNNNEIDNNNNDEIDNDNKIFNEYTAIVYQSLAVNYCDENNFKSIIANDHIKFGSIIMIEHILMDDFSNCMFIVENNEVLFDTYHPRTNKFINLTREERRELAIKKINSNAFGHQDKKLLTRYITCLNHSCNPNCFAFIRDKYEFEATNIIFMELYAIKDIKIGEELTISYGPKTGHERDFECSCGKELEEREKIFDITNKIGSYLSAKSESQIKELIYNYLQTKLSRKILLNHYLVSKGLAMDQDALVSFTKDGSDYVNEIVNKKFKSTINDNANDNANANIDNPAIVFSNEITTQKIEMFMRLIDTLRNR